MKKTRILGMGNKDNFNFIILKKEDNFFDFINELFIQADNEIDVPKYEEKILRNVNGLVDKHESYESDKTRLDIFFGEEKIFITFLTSQTNRERIMEKLEGIGEFEESKETNTLENIK